MIVFNITTKVHPAVNDAWLQWQQDHYIPAIMATGLFTRYQLHRLLEQDDKEGKTYTLQFHAIDLRNYEMYMQEHATRMQQKSFQRWGDKIISFRSVMEVIG